MPTVFSIKSINKEIRHMVLASGGCNLVEKREYKTHLKQLETSTQQFIIKY